jgi:hypothetical protein
VDCQCEQANNHQLVQKLVNMEQELVEVARQILKTASDPFTGVIKFLHERPENNSLPGKLVTTVLHQTFGNEEIPGLIKIMSGHVREIYRNANVIDIIKEHPTAEKWGNFIIKQKDRIKFEVGLEKGRLVLNNIQGLIGVEHGIELPLEKITVSPPNLIVTVKMGMLHPQRIVSI